MRNRKTLNLTLIAIFIGLILLQSFVPNLGYIRVIPALPAISSLVLTVSIGGALLGPKSGLALGLFWGLSSLFMAYTQPSDPLSLLLFQNPIIAVVPRMLVGLFAGLVASFFKKRESKNVQLFGYGLSGLVGALSNTFLVISFASLFFLNNPTAITSHLGVVNQNNPLIIILLVALGLNGIVEAVASSILTPIVVIPLQKVLERLES